MAHQEPTHARSTIEFEVEVLHRGQLMELARKKVEEIMDKEHWVDNYPECWEEALHFLLTEGGISALPFDGPVEVHTTTSTTVLIDPETHEPIQRVTSG